MPMISFPESFPTEAAGELIELFRSGSKPTKATALAAWNVVGFALDQIPDAESPDNVVGDCDCDCSDCETDEDCKCAVLDILEEAQFLNGKPDDVVGARKIPWARLIALLLRLLPLLI